MTIFKESTVYHGIYPQIDSTWLVYLFVLSIPFYGYSFFNIGDRGLLRPDWFFASLIIIVFYLKFCLRKERLQINAIGKWILLLNFVAILSLFKLLNGSSEQLTDFFTKYLQLLLVSLLYFAVSSLNVGEEKINNILKVWILTAFFISLYTIYQVFARNLDLPFAYPPILNPTYGTGLVAGQTFGDYTRPSSFFVEPSYLGSYLIAPLILLITILLNPSQKALLFKKLVILIIGGCIALALVLTFSLATYVTIGLIAFFILMGKVVKKIATLSFIAVIFFAVYILLPRLGINFLTAFERVENEVILPIITGVSPGITSLGMRLAKAVTTFKVGLAHPFLGVGLNNTSYYAFLYEPEWYTGGLPLEENHNMWITTFGEMGILGLIALISLWYSALKKVKYSASKNENKWKIIFIAFYFILWSDIINSNFTHEIMHPQRWFNLSIVGLLINNVSNKRRKDSN